MSKRKPQQAAEEKEETMTQETQAPVHQMPEGFEDASADLVGYWDLVAPIFVIPLYITLSDSKLEPLKTSVLIHCKAVQDTKVIKDEETGEYVDVRAGDLVGVWYKPGMKAIGTCKDIPVYLYQDGELDTGKKNPMKVFKVGIKSGSPRVPLPIMADYRKTSRRNQIPVQGLAAPTQQQRQQRRRSEVEEFGPDDDIPF